MYLSFNYVIKDGKTLLVYQRQRKEVKILHLHSTSSQCNPLFKRNITYCIGK